MNNVYCTRETYEQAYELHVLHKVHAFAVQEFFLNKVLSNRRDTLMLDVNTFSVEMVMAGHLTCNVIFHD
jgi:hypothetical protein